MADFLKLSFALQAALASGYLAYMIAYAGIRQHHTATDTFFRSAAFGLVATVIITWGYDVPGMRTLVAVACTVVAGVLWRWFGMEAWGALMRNAGVSWADDIPSAWITITAQNTKFRPSQVVVDVDGGRTLMCDDTRVFRNAPHGPCAFGLDGSIALYVTSERGTDGKWFDHNDVSHTAEGSKMTYVPASVVKRVEIRFWTEANEQASQVAKTAEPKAEPAA